MLVSALRPLLITAIAVFLAQAPAPGIQQTPTAEAANMLPGQATRTGQTGRTGQTARTAEQTEQSEQGEIAIAGKNISYKIRRLPLSAFPELPASARSVLENRHCLVPQTYEAHRPENVIHGHFLEAGSDDWAVLCSSQGSTSLMILSGDKSIGDSQGLASYRDLDRLSVPAGKEAGYNWGIDVASPKRVRELSGQSSGNFDHDGIEDAVVERSSSIHYYRAGGWLTFERAE